MKDVEAISLAIDTIGTKHRLEAICRLLVSGSSNFNELKRALRMNSTTLSRTLKFLEGKSIVKRKVISAQPISVSYSLTDIGKEFSEIMKCMSKWGEKLTKKSR